MTEVTNDEYEELMDIIRKMSREELMGFYEDVKRKWVREEEQTDG